jgi:hypothetical protein
MEAERTTGEAQAACWCTRAAFSSELLAQVPDGAAGRACICQSCAAGMQPRDRRELTPASGPDGTE